MPWKEHRVMSLKVEFVHRAKSGTATISELCREYGISRQTGHKWLKRFEADGYDGLEEQSRRPKTTPLGTAEEIVASILEAREAHPRWGPHKLSALLRRKYGPNTPSERTVARVLTRFDKVRHRQRRRGLLHVRTQAPSVEVKAPNDLWTVDFKGWWRAGNRQRCEPLTVRDAFSRFVLAIEVLPGTGCAPVRTIFERLFRRYGLPKAVQCDNGSPFVAATARAGLSSLSAWWVSLGIELVRSRPGCPQDNGAHERMHADMAAEIEAEPSASRALQQRACTKWRQQFNHVRPHDALDGKTPAEVYKRSERAMRVRSALYPAGWLTRVVNPNGCLCVHSDHYFVSASLGGHHVGLERVNALQMRVWFYELDLGIIEIPAELPIAVASVASCSSASRVRALLRRAPASPPLTRPVRAASTESRATGRRMPPAGALGARCASPTSAADKAKP
jgi:transposase InsO family protein